MLCKHFFLLFYLQYMHERNILHRDLKTQNIFLTKSKIIKVGDLGIARVLEGTNDMATTLIGTPYYMSPELFSNRPYNHRVSAIFCNFCSSIKRPKFLDTSILSTTLSELRSHFPVSFGPFNM